MPNKLNKNLSVISLDSLKTFARVGRDFVFFALQKLGYGDKFIHMMKFAFTNIQSKIEINDLLSDPFTVMRGAHQERPILILLYIIAAEVLANFIGKD